MFACLGRVSHFTKFTASQVLFTRASALTASVPVGMVPRQVAGWCCAALLLLLAAEPAGSLSSGPPPVAARPTGPSLAVSLRPARRPAACPTAVNAGPREAVTDALKHSPWPFFGTAGSAGTIRISDGIAYSNGVAQLSGAPSYLAAAEAWHEQLLDEAPDAAVSIVRVTQTDPATVVVRYNISWTPPSAAWLASLGEAVPAWRVVRVDLLHRLRERAVFKWRNVAALFLRAAQTGELLVPRAVIQCSAQLSFVPRETGDDPVCELVAQHERVDLIESVRSGELQNRALARDLLLFLDSRRPPGWSVDDWNAEVLAQVNIEAVPGMGQFDIDGLDSQDQSDLVSGGAAALGYLTVCVLAVGASIGAVYFAQLNEARDMQRELDLLGASLSLLLSAASP